MSARRTPILLAAVQAQWQEEWLAEKGLPEATMRVLGGDSLGVVLHARSKGHHLFVHAPALLDEPEIDPKEFAATVEVLIDGLVAEATELPDDPRWLTEQEKAHAVA